MWRLIVSEAREEGLSASAFVRESSIAYVWYTRGARDRPFNGSQAIEAPVRNGHQEPRAVDYGLVVGAATLDEGDDDPPEVRPQRPTDATGDMRKHLVRLGRQTWQDVHSEARLAQLSPSQYIREGAWARAVYLRARRDEPRAREVRELLGEEALAIFGGNYAAMIQRLDQMGVKLPQR